MEDSIKILKHTGKVLIVLKLKDFLKPADWENLLSGRMSADMSDAVRAELKQKGVDLENFYQEIEMNSRFVNTHPDNSRYAMELHSHNFYEILYIRRGNVQYLLGTNRYGVQPGDVIFIPPQVSHRALLANRENEPYERYVLWLSREFVAMLRSVWPGLRLNGDRCRLLRMSAEHRDSIGRLFHRGISFAAEGRPGSELEVMGNTFQLLVQLERLFSDDEITPPEREKRELLDDIVEYIELHLAGKITLEGTARHFLVSRSTVSHAFQQRLNVSFYRFVTQRRLLAARERILAGDAMNSIAEQVGFSDYSAFYRAFKQEYGIAPRDYAKLRGGREA